MYYGIDSLYIILVIPAMLFALWAQYRVKHAYAKYASVRARSGVTANAVVRRVLQENGVTGVSISHTPGQLTDHYDPREEVIRLSDSVDNSASIAAIGVAAHEAGHACQHADRYAPLTIRNSIIPLTQVGSSAAIPLVLAGFFLNSDALANSGVLLFGLVVVFQLITLPVEFNASRRALAVLRSGGLLDEDEIKGARSVLTAAALTYVAAMVVALAQFLRLMITVRRRR